MKHLTTTLITLSLAALLLGACSAVPASPASIASPLAGPAATRTAAGWQTYTNAEAGFSIQYPPTWSQQTLPDQNNGAIHGTGLHRIGRRRGGLLGCRLWRRLPDGNRARAVGAG